MLQRRGGFVRTDRQLSQEARYDWLVDMVDTSRYGQLTRRGIVGASVAIGAWPILMSLSPSGVTGALRPVSVMLGLVAMACGAGWVSSWPTYRQSQVIVVALNTSIAANCVLYAAVNKSGTSTLAFALTASYVACVHTLPYLAWVFGVAAIPVLLRVVIMATEGEMAAGVADGVLRLSALVVVPLSVRTLVQLLGDHAVDSYRDPLTDLANRRGFDRAVRQLLRGAAADGNTRVCVTMIDVDRFKSINDTRGHAIGDGVLVTLAHTLRRTCTGGSVIARIGGEEFVVVALCEADEAMTVAQRLRSEFAVAEWAFTASFGIATATLSRRAAPNLSAFTRCVLAAADDAMYEAKRAGGDRIHRARPLDQG